MEVFVVTIAVFRGGAPHFSSLLQLTCVVFPLHFGGPSKNKVHTLSHMLHGAGIFTYMTGWFWTRANVGIHIPAPWFAYGYDEWYAMSLCGFAMLFQLNPGWCCDNVIVNTPAPWSIWDMRYKILSCQIDKDLDESQDFCWHLTSLGPLS